MSKATPMTTSRRLAIYRRTNNGSDRLTPAQERQVRKQENKLAAHRRRRRAEQQRNRRAQKGDTP